MHRTMNLKLTEITYLVKSVFSICHGWRKWTESRHKGLFQSQSSATETLVLVQKVSGKEALNLSKVFRWYSRFRDGRELVEDDERGGCQQSTRTEVNIAVVAADLVKNNRRIVSRKSAESLNIPNTVVLRVLIKGFLLSRFFLVAR
jgi:hypothetical protein